MMRHDGVEWGEIALRTFEEMSYAIEPCTSGEGSESTRHEFGGRFFADTHEARQRADVTGSAEARVEGLALKAAIDLADVMNGSEGDQALQIRLSETSSVQQAGEARADRRHRQQRLHHRGDVGAMADE
jgi:hypothetical protein